MERSRPDASLPFALAWEAFGAGSRPIGAALLDAEGAVVACGRNRSQEAAAPPGQLAGAAIAHAEINVLAQLPSRRRYEDHRLFTTLEPCLLCSGALLHARVGTVVYAAADHIHGPLAVFGAMLPYLWTLRHAPETPGAPETGEQPRRDGPLGLARRCLDTPGFTEAETVEAAYRLALPRIAEAGP
ncbi:nucleoside deaminase [Streptomyces kanamyceticus]|uniref:nucleoside deaminase n=1 Tax=Streptomyces kanamyceticus TaxID=1967 RepID=UPI0037DDB772